MPETGDRNPSEPRTGRPAVRLPWGLAGMLLLALAVEAGFSRNADQLIERYDWMARLARARAARDAPRAGVLCVGDSQLMGGIWPPAVEQRCGRSVVNLAVAAAPAPVTEELLRRALQRGARPEAVVVDFAPLLLNFGPRKAAPQYRAVMDPRLAADLAWSERDPALFAELLAQAYLPSLRARSAAREAVQAKLRGEVSLTHRLNLSQDRQSRRNRGSVLIASHPKIDDTPEALLVWLRENFPGVDARPRNLRAIERVLSLARQSGARVFWVLPPILPAAQDVVESSGRDAEHLAFVRAWQARFPGITVVDARRALSDPRAFADHHHLSAEGSHALSLALGDLLRRELGTPGPGAPKSWRRIAGLSPAPLPADVEPWPLTDQLVMYALKRAVR